MSEGKSEPTAAGGLVNITACPQYNREHALTSGDLRFFPSCLDHTRDRHQLRDFVARGSWLAVRGSWFVVRGSWFVVRGSWFVVRGSWFVAIDLVTINEPRSTINDQRSTNHDQRSTTTKNWVPGNERFKRLIVGLAGRRASPARRGPQPASSSANRA
jgi:hypothetical protein